MQHIEKNIKLSNRLQYNYYQLMDHFLGRDRSFKLHEEGRRRFYSKLHDQLKSKGIGQVRPVERRKDLSLKEFKNHYMRKGIPVVMEGAAKEWDCVKKWSFDYFKDLHGKDEIVMVDQKHMENDYKKTTLADAIDEIKKGNGEYYRFYPLLERHPEHIKDFDYTWLLKRKNKVTWFEAFQVFIGGEGTVTPLHNANQCNLFVQTHGEKKWMLYPNESVSVIDPSPIRNVYRSAPYKTESGPFDPFNPDYETPYTLFKYLDSYEVHLKPGDVFWNPPFYWHAVKNIGESIGVGYRWFSPFYMFKTSPLYSFLDLCVTNPPFWKAYQLYRKDINLIHLAEHGKLDKFLEDKGMEELHLGKKF